MKGPSDKRVAALRRFAVSITLFTITGGSLLGFEDAWAQPLVALTTAYALELMLESLEAWAERRPLRFAGGVHAFVDFLLPAHISALSIALLLYPGEQMMPIVFATAVAVGSKFLIRAPVAGRWRHFLNPSNLGIAATLLVFPWVGIAPPYHFTENVSGLLDWALPIGVLVFGTALNAKLTGKIPLILGWSGGFAFQAVTRSLVFGTPVVAALMPLTGFVFILYTNYMITDPGTTPVNWRSQVVFGAATALGYGILVSAHVVFGLFFALTITSALRGLGLYTLAAREIFARRLPEPIPAKEKVAVL